MATDPLPALSDLSSRSTTRRDFLIKSSALGALAPFALSACDIDESAHKPIGPAGTTAGTSQAGPRTAVRNPDSKLDTGGHAEDHSIPSGRGATLGRRSGMRSQPAREARSALAGATLGHHEGRPK